jgi:hypothetical protein
MGTIPELEAIDRTGSGLLAVCGMVIVIHNCGQLDHGVPLPVEK